MSFSYPHAQRQTDRQTDRQTHTHTHTQTDTALEEIQKRETINAKVLIVSETEFLWAYFSFTHQTVFLLTGFRVISMKSIC